MFLSDYGAIAAKIFANMRLLLWLVARTFAIFTSAAG